MSRQVPIRYRVEPTNIRHGYDGGGRVAVASSGDTVAICHVYANAVMIADALNKANGVGPAEPLVERVKRLETWRGEIEKRLLPSELRERYFPASPMKGGVIFPDDESNAYGDHGDDGA